MTRIRQLAAELNQVAGGFEIGRLQELRVQIHGLSRRASRDLFSVQSIKDNYAFHLGGRTELQFNIGKEELLGRQIVRRCVAFDLETSPTLPTIDPLRPKIDRFNEYVRSRADAFPEFSMWHYTGDERSADLPLQPIRDEWVYRGNFIALGRHSAPNQVNAAEVLRDFDRLLPLYVYVESKRLRQSMRVDPFFGAACPDFAETATASLPARVISIGLRHKRLQKVLHSCLSEEYGAANVRTETGGIDAITRHKKEFSFYELKTACSVRLCVREALGQLLEYAYWPTAERAQELVVVGEATVDPDTIHFLELLRKKFRLPLYYRRLDETTGILGPKS
ncbi:MAG: hypothetical protein ACJ8R9_24370 [Steroidobacteraceae bacterium]